MVAVLLGKPSRGPIHPDYVPSIFSFQKTTQSVPSTRYLRAVRRSRTRSALISKCSKQPSAEVKGENGQGDDAIDLTDTVEGESENEAVASCSTSTEYSLTLFGTARLSAPSHYNKTTNYSSLHI